MTSFTRRGFLATSAASTAALLLPARLRASPGPMSLAATTRTIEVNGRAATVYGLVNAQGGLGLTLDPAQQFRVDLTNTLPDPTIIHWHGQIPPNAQDGVRKTNPMLASGETRAFDFEPRSGTHWMHSHLPAEEVGLLAAPLIVRTKADLGADRQEVVMFLHDFSFRAPEEVLSEVTSGMAMDHSAMGQGGGAMQGMAGMDHGKMNMAEMEMDLNDFEFDAYLANDRTLGDPDVIQVEKGGRVLIRAINASSMTSYWIEFGGLLGRLVAVDGEACQPLAGKRFGFAPGQRLDIELEVPSDGTAVPVLALREGARERTGLILAPKGATVSRLSDVSDSEHPAFSGDLAQEAMLRALHPLADRAADTSAMVMLEGAMMPYVWTINGAIWGDHKPIEVRSGQRVELTFHNMSTMAHPMHLHGHAFQVVSLGSERFAGAVRDTVNVPPMSMVTVAFDAGEVAPWMMHCHHMGHLETGMMTELVVAPRERA